MAGTRCVDTVGWDNGPRPGGALTCVQYEQRFCSQGAFLPGAGWTSGSEFNFPEKHCCECGKQGRRAATGAGKRQKQRKASAGARPTPAQPVTVAAAPSASLAMPPRRRPLTPLAEAPPCWDRKLESPKVPWGGDYFCPNWPLYDNGTALTLRQRALIRGAAQRALRPFQGGISGEQIAAALEPRCAQRLCMHVQILDGRLYLVAPHSVKCEPGAQACSVEARRKTPGIFAGYTEGWNPNQLEWHWYAGINVSSCSARVEAGDWNGHFTRLRMTNALRLLEEAARHGVPDLELVLCVNEVAPNAGDWCLKGAQPVFASTGNEESPLLPFVHWMPKLRDWDLSVWDEVRKAQDARRQAAKPAATPPRDVAGFRGGIYRLNVYSDEWRQRGARRTQVHVANWRSVGRAALVAAKSDAAIAPLLDVSIKGGKGPLDNKFGKWKRMLKVGPSYLDALDSPESLSAQRQAAAFRYTLNIEGHGGWADRLYTLFSSRQLVIAQDLPFRLWYEQLTAPGVTHVATDSNLRNLSGAVRWARAHGDEVDAMVARANQAMRAATSTAGIRLYVRELLHGYAELLRRRGYTPRRAPRAVQLACRHSEECRDCAANGHVRSMCGVVCAFRVGDREFGTLHEAGEALGSSAAGASTQPPGVETEAKARPRHGRASKRGGSAASHSSKAARARGKSTGHKRAATAT